MESRSWSTIHCTLPLFHFSLIFFFSWWQSRSTKFLTLLSLLVMWTWTVKRKRKYKREVIGVPFSFHHVMANKYLLSFIYEWPSWWKRKKENSEKSLNFIFLHFMVPHYVSLTLSFINGAGLMKWKMKCATRSKTSDRSIFHCSFSVFPTTFSVLYDFLCENVGKRKKRTVIERSSTDYGPKQGNADTFPLAWPLICRWKVNGWRLLSHPAGCSRSVSSQALALRLYYYYLYILFILTRL